MKDQRFLPHFIVKNGIHGIGVFTTMEFKKGSILRKLEGGILNHPTRTSVQIDEHKHIEDELAGFINHSCTPNIWIDQKNRVLISLRDIKKDEEITFDYDANEDELSSPFQCECCGRMIKGKKFISR